MEGQDLAGKEKSRESHHGTSYMRKGAETDCGEGLCVNSFPAHHSLDESTTCLSSLLFRAYIALETRGYKAQTLSQTGRALKLGEKGHRDNLGTSPMLSSPL